MLRHLCVDAHCPLIRIDSRRCQYACFGVIPARFVRQNVLRVVVTGRRQLLLPCRIIDRIITESKCVAVRSTHVATNVS